LNLAVRVELGRLSLESSIKTQTSLYLLRINNDNINPLLKEAFHLSMAPPKNHAVGDILIVTKLESIWFVKLKALAHESSYLLQASGCDK
jgi:hypothetical protein